MAVTLPATATDPAEERIVEDVADTDPSLGAVSDDPVAGEIAEQRGEVVATIHAPKSWDDCYEERHGKPRRLNVSRVIEFLHERKAYAIDGWQPLSPELSLAIAKEPGKEPPYSMGIFTPLPSADPEERRKHGNNLRIIIHASLLHALCPEEEIPRVTRALCVEYGRKLKQVRETHVEAELRPLSEDGEETQLTTASILNAFKRIEAFYSGHTDDKAIAPLAIAAEEIYRQIAQNSNSHFSTGGEDGSVFEPVIFAPSRYFETGNDTTKRQTVQLIIFLHLIGMIDVTQITQPQLLQAFYILNEVAGNADHFLAKGEKIYERCQARDLFRRDEHTRRVAMEDGVMAVDREISEMMARRQGIRTEREEDEAISLDSRFTIDKSDVLEDVKADNIFELIRFCLNTKNSLTWRNQAAAMLAVRLKLISMRLDLTLRYAGYVDQRLRGIITDWKRWLTEDTEDRNSATNGRQLARTMYHYYEDGKGNRKPQPEEDFTIEKEMECRQWKSPLSGRVYDVRIVDEGDTIKSDDSLLLKSFLNNSIWFYDKVRFSFIFANVVDFTSDPVARKDAYYFGHMILSDHKCRLGTKDSAKIDWNIENADAIIQKMSGRRTLLDGDATVEDTTIELSSNDRRGPGIADIKVVGRDPRYGTGFEIRMLQLSGGPNSNNIGWCEETSRDHPSGHDRYDEKKTRALMQQIFSPQHFPRTWLIIRVLNIMSKFYPVRYTLHATQRHRQILEVILDRVTKELAQVGQDPSKAQIKEALNKKGEECIDMVLVDSGKIEDAEFLLRQVQEIIDEHIPLIKALHGNEDLSLIEEKLYEVVKKTCSI